MTAAPVRSCPREMDAQRRVVGAMLDQLEPVALVELMRMTQALLGRRVTAAEQRLDELEPLKLLLACGVRTAFGYDAVRPLGAPQSAALRTSYGTWDRACAAAREMCFDGHFDGRRRFFRTFGVGMPHPPTYTHAEIGRAIRRCAGTLGKRPSAHTYEMWARDTRKRLIAAGVWPVRIPRMTTIYGHYPGWNSALTDAAVTDQLLLDARAKWLPDGTAISRNAFITRINQRLAERGLEPLPADASTPRWIHQLALGEAVQLAATLAVSLDWLAGRTTDPGQPPAVTAAFSPGELRRLRLEAGISDLALQIAAGYTLGPWRRMMRGSEHPTLGVVVAIADRLGASPVALLTRPPPAGALR